MIRKLLVILGLLMLTGCTDGVLYQMKRANPYYRAQWQKDRELGITFLERVDELELLAGTLPKMDPAQQADWLNRLEKLIAKDPSPEIRAQALRVISTVPGEASQRAINIASTDSSEKVRLAACAAWGSIKGEAARDMLLTLANNVNETTSVRQAALRGLSSFDEPEVREALTEMLSDRSPAIQYQTTRSLKELTGRDYGGDMQAWRDYMAGTDVPEPQKSVAESLRSSLGILR